jgi:hypothetical protein
MVNNAFLTLSTFHVNASGVLYRPSEHSLSLFSCLEMSATIDEHTITSDAGRICTPLTRSAACGSAKVVPSLCEKFIVRKFIAG